MGLSSVRKTGLPHTGAGAFQEGKVRSCKASCGLGCETCTLSLLLARGSHRGAEMDSTSRWRELQNTVAMFSQDTPVFVCIVIAE